MTFAGGTPVPVQTRAEDCFAMTPEALADGIRQLLDHPEMCEKFTNALKNESFDNAKEMQKLYDFIES